MDLSISQKALRGAAEQARQVTNPRSPSEIAKSLRIEALPGEIRLAGTDTFVGATMRLSADVKEPGVTVVDAAEFADRVARRLPEGDVRIKVNGSRLTFHAKGRKLELPSGDGSLFPEPARPPQGGISLAGKDLAWVLDAVSFAASDDIARPHMAGVDLRMWRPGQLRAVATDGHRLSFAHLACAGEFAAFLPKRAAQLLARIAETQEEARLVVDGKTVWLVGGALRFHATTLDASPPDYDFILDKLPERTLIDVDRMALLDGVRATQSSHDAGGHVVFAARGHGLHLTAESAQRGAAAVEVEAVVKGPEAVVGLQEEYLSQQIDSLTDERITLAFGGELDPVVVRAKDVLGIVMPCRLRDA